ncbi:competence type IV pilus major pilin ComGC [Cytobacillus oceanisediminis]|uniref:competence type IV pilus major pilin ComGC n=1 Tax=Cytobacillus oceanisediminis TaxID=665099 RepID=UPI0037366BA7
MKLQKIKNDKGFTLIEMMIVLLVISVLLIITIPNVTKHNSKINSKGCEAFIHIIDTNYRFCWEVFAINKNTIDSMTDVQKDKALYDIVELYNSIKNPKKVLSDDFHEVADALYKIIVYGENVIIKGYERKF